MRGALIISLLLILFAPACAATQPIIPVVTLTLQPSSVNVTSTPTQRASADFNGTVTMDKLPLERIVVSLLPSVDAGWASSCSPDSMVITDEQPHQFSCTVIIPEGQPNITGTLTVEATARGGGFVVSTSVQAVIVVKGIALANGTGDNLTAAGGTRSSTQGLSEPASFNMVSLLIVGVVVAVAVSVTYLGYRRWKGRPYDAELIE